MGFIQVTARGANIKSLVTNNERKLKIFNFSGLLENSKMKSQPNGYREKNSSSGKKFERDTSYCVLKPTRRGRLDLVR